jgi:hypothetical protein
MSERPPRRWLVLSHGFNMDGRAASLTVTDKIPYLLAAGIEPVIVSAVTGEPDARFEHRQLLPWGPAGLRFDLRHLLARRWGRGFGYRIATLAASIVLAPGMLLERLAFGLRSQWSWALPAYRHARRRVARGDIELVYSSGGAYSAHLAAAWLKRRSGCRWIAEIHDPLVIPGRAPANRDERFQARLERRICEEADLVWWFTEGALASARARTPALGARGVAILPGADPPLERVAYARGERCVIAHFGSLAATRSLVPALAALDALLRRRPAWRAQVQLAVYGGDLDEAARRFVEARGLADIVLAAGRLERDPASGRSGRERVLERMQRADVLLLLHGQVPECAEYIPSKLYDYFWARRPVLALTWRNAQLDALVAAHGGSVAPTDDPAAIEAVLESIFERWQRDALPDVAAPPVTVEAAVQAIVRLAAPPRDAG